MAKITPNLGLYEKESIDSNDTFNIQTMLNDNFDKLDADSKTKDDNIAEINNAIGADTLETTNQTLKGAINEVKNNTPTIPSSLPANGGNSTTVNNHTAAAIPNTTEKNDLIGMVNEVSTQMAEKASQADVENLGNIVSTKVSATGQDITYYVDATNGNDTTGDGTQIKPFATIQHTIDLLPQIINNTVTINVTKGNYNENLKINGVIGKGSISLLLNGSTISNLNIEQCNIFIYVTNFIASCPDSPSGHALGIAYCIYVKISGMTSTNTTTNNTTSNVYVAGSLCEIGQSTLSNKYYGIWCNSSAKCLSINNAGTGNQIGLLSQFNASIGKSGSQPGGATAESTNNGGIIRQ